MPRTGSDKTLEIARQARQSWTPSVKGATDFVKQSKDLRFKSASDQAGYIAYGLGQWMSQYVQSCSKSTLLKEALALRNIATTWGISFDKAYSRHDPVEKNSINLYVQKMFNSLGSVHDQPITLSPLSPDQSTELQVETLKGEGKPVQDNP
jgi:hypothetical protein